jgi:uncharacterized phage protein gp47/JayE
MSAPTVSDLYDSLVTTLESKLGQDIPILPKAFLRVLAMALAGVVCLLYRYSGSNRLDYFPRTANAEDQVINGRVFNALEACGERVGAPVRAAATAAVVTVQIPKSPANAATIVANGAKMRHAGTGITFIVETSLAGSTTLGQYTARASTFDDGTSAAGIAGNIPAAENLVFASPVAGLATQGTTTGISVTGVDEEDAEAYRQRIVDFTGARKHGGSASDYVEWARTVPNVVDVYPYAGATTNTVDVYFSVADQPNGIPTAAQIADVADALRFTEDSGDLTANRSPINDLPIAIPIRSTAFNVEVYALAGVSDVAATKARITEALTDYFNSMRPYCPGVGFPPRKDLITGPAVAAVVQEVVLNDGGTAGTVNTRESGTIVVARSLGQGEHARLGTVTWL